MQRFSLSLVALAVSAVVLIAAGLGGGYWLATKSTHSSAAANKSAERKILYWYDPMQPTQHFDKPGKSPFMDMELVPKYADDNNVGNETANGEAANSANENAGVRIDTRAAHNFAVRLARVEQSEFGDGFEVIGTIEFNARRVAIVQAWADGYVARVYAHAPGDVLKPNEPLADLTVPTWLGAQTEYLALRKNGDPELIAAAYARLKTIGMPENIINGIARNNTPKNNFTITAPIGGALQNLNVRKGMAVTRGMTLAEINDLSSVWLNAAVPENKAAQIKLGDTMIAQLNDSDGREISGRVVALLPQTDNASRTVTVRAELDNRDGQLRPGQFARVRVQRAATTTLTVPSEAIIRSGTRAVVILAENNRYRSVEVVTGAEAHGRTAIAKGLVAGQQVVASSQFLIDSEANLNGALERLNAERIPENGSDGNSIDNSHEHRAEPKP